MSGQGSPPGRNPTNVELNVLVGDAKAGAAAFGTLCSSCHSVTGDLKGIASKFEDARALQNGWVAGSTPAFAGGRGGGGGAGNPVTVTLADGSKLEGTLIRKDDFLVVFTLPDGTRKSIRAQQRHPESGREGSERGAQEDGAAARRSGEQEDARHHRLPVDD